MSESDFSVSESVTDTEFEEALEEVEWQKERDIESEILLDRMRECNISMARLDGMEINRWLRGRTELDDVLACGRLKKKGSTVLLDYISQSRVDELRSFAREVISFYDGGTQFKSYVDRVLACIIEFEYFL